MADVLRLPRRFQRPLPPPLDPGAFVPAPDLETWIRAVFIEQGGPLLNPGYGHLAEAVLGCLWTDVPNLRGGRVIIGQAELMPPMAMGKWQKARAEWQIETWFGQVPDFLLTFHAGVAATMDDASFCALVEHELHHCAQDVDQYGTPKFRQDGRPRYRLVGHDIEEFVGVVERYGAEATMTQALVDAAKRGPTVARASIAQACGTCAGGRRAA